MNCISTANGTIFISVLWHSPNDLFKISQLFLPKSQPYHGQHIYSKYRANSININDTPPGALMHESSTITNTTIVFKLSKIYKLEFIYRVYSKNLFTTNVHACTCISLYSMICHNTEIF